MTSSSPGESPLPRSWWLAAGALLVLASALRLASLGFGLDLSDPGATVHNVQLDERGMVRQEVELLQGDWHPGEFLLRGTAPFYLAGAADAAVVGVVAAASGEGWEATVAGLDANPSLIFWVHRLLAALTGVLTVLVVMRLTLRELGPRPALLAGLFLAVAHLHVNISNLGLVDVPWVLFALLGFERTLRAIREPRRAHFLLAGLWFGLAAATKYPGGLAATLLPVGWLLARREARRSGAQPPGWRDLAGGVLATAATFLACSPRLLTRPGEYRDAIGTQVAILDIAERAEAYGDVLREHVRLALGVGLGEPLLIAILLGFVVAVRRGGAARRLAFLSLLFVPTAMVAKTPAPRFATGFLVAMVPVAAIGVDALCARLGRVPGALLVVLVVAPSLLRATTYISILRGHDTRLELVAELQRRGLAREDVVGIGHRGLPDPTGIRLPFVSLTREMRRGRMQPADVLRDPPGYILRDLGSGVPEEQVWGPFRALVEAEYEECFRVDGRRHPTEGPAPAGYYLLTRTYVPFATPWETKRPGPGLVLFRRRGIADSPAPGAPGAPGESVR